MVDLKASPKPLNWGRYFVMSLYTTASGYIFSIAAVYVSFSCLTYFPPCPVVRLFNAFWQWCREGWWSSIIPYGDVKELR